MATLGSQPTVELIEDVVRHAYGPPPALHGELSRCAGVREKR